MNRTYKDENGLIRTKKHSVSYYIIWYFVCVGIVAVYHLITKQFAWGRLGVMALVLGIVSVGWFFMDRISVKQEESMARELEARKRGKSGQNP